MKDSPERSLPAARQGRKRDHSASTDYQEAVREVFGSEATMIAGVKEDTWRGWHRTGVPAYHVIKFLRERNRRLEAAAAAGMPRATKSLLTTIRELELAEQSGEIKEGDRADVMRLAVQLIAILRHDPDLFGPLKLFLETLSRRAVPRP